MNLSDSNKPNLISMDVKSVRNPTMLTQQKYGNKVNYLEPLPQHSSL